MSVTNHQEPSCSELDAPSIELEVEGRERSLGDGFTVRRLLPSVMRRMGVPFVFFDQSSREKIERAKLAWRERSFPSVPGDAQEFIPLPDDLPPRA